MPSSNIQFQTIKASVYGREISDGQKLLRILAMGLCALISTAILQDFIHSRLNGYSFYFSESLLFKTVWFLFAPIVFLQIKFLQKAKIEIIARNVLTILLPISIHLLALPLIVWFVSWAFYSHAYSYARILTYTIAEDFYKLLLIYGLSFIFANYFFGKSSLLSQKNVEARSENRAETESESIPENRPQFLETIVVSSGGKYIPIAVSDVLYFGAATPYIEIRLTGKRYLHHETLKAISEKLDQTRFVRIHKSTVVNLEKIVSYKSRLNGDYDLLLEDNSEIRLSRNYAAEFKKLFAARPQVKS